MAFIINIPVIIYTIILFVAEIKKAKNKSDYAIDKLNEEIDKLESIRVKRLKDRYGSGT